MKTLVDIDEDLLTEAVTLAGVPTKKETIRRALVEYIRARRREGLKRMAGSGIVTLTHAELRQARRRRRDRPGDARARRQPVTEDDVRQAAVRAIPVEPPPAPAPAHEPEPSHDPSSAPAADDVKHKVGRPASSEVPQRLEMDGDTWVPIMAASQKLGLSRQRVYQTHQRRGADRAAHTRLSDAVCVFEVDRAVQRPPGGGCQDSDNVSRASAQARPMTRVESNQVVLVDTSAWISFFAKSGYPAIKDALAALLDNDQVATAGPIVLEVLQGCRSTSERVRLEQNLRALHWLPVEDRHWFLAGAMAFRLRRRGVTVSAVDVLIATLAESHGYPLLQQDRGFVSMARHSGLRLLEIR